MSRNILLTSLDAMKGDPVLSYYSAPNELGCDYCEALQSMEASTKLILARFPIDDIYVIGADGGDMNTVRLRDAGDLCSADPRTLSAFDLYRSRIAQYINETSLEQQACEALLPEETRAKLIDFTQRFQEEHSSRELKRINRFFDELANDQQLYGQFRDALLDAVPEAGKDSRLTMKWVRNYLYMQLKPSAKLEVLPANEDIRAHCVPSEMLEKREYWMGSILNANQAGEQDDINLYVSVGRESAVDGQLLMNMLDILIATPGSRVHLKKLYRVYESYNSLAGAIVDGTALTLSTDLVAAAHAFLNYSKTDMLVHFWENAGEHDPRISSLIYAARHVDVGISMCNIPEVQEGIDRLRELLMDERSWTDTGDYGLLFGVIAGCIQADYAPLLAGDGKIAFIELIKWAYRHQLYQQVLTLIESHAPTNLVKSGIFYYCDDEASAPEVTNLFAQQRLELKPYEYYKMDDVDHYFVKNYDRGSVRLNGSRGEDRSLVYAALRVKSIENSDPAKITGCTACSNTQTLPKTVCAYFRLGDVRNKISHADASAMVERRLIVSESDVSSAMLLMQESIEFFIKSYEEALAEAQGKNPKIVAISPDEIRNAADRMRREQSPRNRQRPDERK